MAGPWEKYANPATRYGADPYKVAEEQRKIADQQMQQEAARRAAEAAERSASNAAQSNAIARQKLEADLAKDGLMVGPDGNVVPRPGGALTKPLPQDPQRAAQIKSLLEVIKRTREQADDFWAVGTQGGRAREWPIIGPTLGQNRSDVEGLVKSIEGDLIQQQIARLSQVNGGNGVASIANSETEAARMAAAIANLSPDQSYEEFIAGLDRAEDYYRRQGQALGIDPVEMDKAAGKAVKRDDAPIAGGQAPQGPDRSAPLPTNPNFDPTGQKTLGTGNFTTDADRRAHAAMTSAFNRGASAQELIQLNQDLGGIWTAGQIGGAVSYRDGTGRYSKQGPQKGAGFQMPTTGVRSDFNKAVNTGLTWEDPIAGFSPGAAAASGVNALGFGSLEALAPEAFDEMRVKNPGSAFTGDVAGMIGGTSALGKVGTGVAEKYAPQLLAEGTTRLGKVGNFARSVAPDVAYGGIYGGVTEQTPEGAFTGAGLALGGSALGQTIGGKIGQAIGRSETLTNATNRVRGMFGRRQVPAMPTLSATDNMIVNAVGDRGPQVMSNLGDAQRLGIPMALADADTGLTSLAGATVRRSPDAKNIAEQAFEPRALGQYDRFIGALDRDFGGVANIPQRSDDLINQARANAQPLYEAAYSAPGASSVDISGISATPMGQKAFRNAYDDVRNTLGPDGQPMDPKALGFDLNDAGEPILTKVPSFESLDYVKKGLDDVINGGYNPLTKQYTPEARQAIALKNSLVGQIDSVNPDYAAARAAYAGPAGEKQAFEAGVGARNMSPDAMNFALKDMPDPRLEQFRLGRVSDMADQAGKVRLTSNPWGQVAAPQEQAKLGSLFPETAPNFLRQYEIERGLAKSQNQILGNSLTAERQLADQAFGGNIMGDIAFDAATTGAPVKSGMTLLGRLGKDELGRFNAKKKADALAPILFDTEAANAAAAFKEVKKKARTKGIFGRKNRRTGKAAGGAVGAAGAIGAYASQQ